MVAGDSVSEGDMIDSAVCGIVVSNQSEKFGKLRRKPNIYFSHESYTTGIIDGLEHYGLKAVERMASVRFLSPETGKPFIHRFHWLKHLCLRVNVKRVGLHAVRHLTTSILVSEGIPMIEIK